jgi:hypothetical protein
MKGSAMNLLEVGDEITIRYNPCHICENEVGYEEYEMGDYEGLSIILKTENLFSSYDNTRFAPFAPLACGGQRFEYDDWMWTTCWITNHVSVLTNREPDWEI